MGQDLAPHPWRIEDNDSERWGYLSIVDATGNKICDFFPYAGQGGRGREATLALAVKILDWERENAALAREACHQVEVGNGATIPADAGALSEALGGG